MPSRLSCYDCHTRLEPETSYVRPIPRPLPGAWHFLCGACYAQTEHGKIVPPPGFQLHALKWVGHDGYAMVGSERASREYIEQELERHRDHGWLALGIKYEVVEVPGNKEITSSPRCCERHIAAWQRIQQGDRRMREPIQASELYRQHIESSRMMDKTIPEIPWDLLPEFAKANWERIAAERATARGARCRRCNGDDPHRVIDSITELCQECTRSIMNAWPSDSITSTAFGPIRSDPSRIGDDFSWADFTWNWRRQAAVTKPELRPDGFDQRAVDAAKAVLLATTKRSRR